MQVAADVFPIRHVCAFGQNVPDGVIQPRRSAATPVRIRTLHRRRSLPGSGRARRQSGCPCRGRDVRRRRPNGVVPVARNHAELIAGGAAVLLEGGIGSDARLLACCATGSFAGLALTIVPWLLSGGTLLLHHGFDPLAFAAQAKVDRCDTVVVPGTLVPPLTEADLLVACRSQKRARALARARAPHDEPAVAASARDSDRHAGLRRDRADRLPSRRRRRRRPAARFRGHRATRWRQCRSRCRGRADRSGHAGAARPDGAVPSVLAGRCRRRHAATQGRRRRLCRHRLSLPDRSHGRRHDGDRPATRVSSASVAIALPSATRKTWSGAPTARPPSPPCPTRWPDIVSPGIPARPTTCARRSPRLASIRSWPMPSDRAARRPPSFPLTGR